MKDLKSDSDRHEFIVFDDGEPDPQFLAITEEVPIERASFIARSIYGQRKFSVRRLIDPSSPISPPVRLERRTKEPDKRFNLVILGDSGVGKTWLLNRFTDDCLYEGAREEPYPGPKIRTIHLHGEAIWLNISHPKGNNRNDDFTAEQIRLADGIVVVYDVSNQESFTNIQRRWALEIERHARSDVKVILVGNKMDAYYIVDDTGRERHTAMEMEFDLRPAQAYAKEKQWRFSGASARDGINVDDVFLTLANDIVAQLQVNAIPQENLDLKPSMPKDENETEKGPRL